MIGFRKGKIFTAGFTLVELLIYTAMLGIVVGIGVPTWTMFIEYQVLNISQDAILRSLQMAKSNAVKDKISWQVSFREQNGIAQYQLSPVSPGPNPSQWQSLSPKVKIDTANTTFYYSNQERIWKMEFDHYGVPNGQIGKVTLSLVKKPTVRRCVVVAMLIGALRTDKNKGCDKY